jgi:hypothetical protein
MCIFLTGRRDGPVCTILAFGKKSSMTFATRGKGILRGYSATRRARTRMPSYHRPLHTSIEKRNFPDFKVFFCWGVGVPEMRLHRYSESRALLQRFAPRASSASQS